mmetsp:Transcript_31069/g.66144  ORF Transcript_31069/g.66144 Transcript_31069/m.66144 type:complete len:221 (-) Transcript_31069:180-842(-)
MLQRIPTMIPRVIFLLAYRADRLRPHGTVRRPAAQFRHVLQLGDHRNVRQGQRAVLPLDQHLVREGDDDVGYLPRQRLVPVSLSAQLATPVVLLAAIAHGQPLLREWHVEGAGHARRPHSAHLRGPLLRGRRRCHHLILMGGVGLGRRHHRHSPARRHMGEGHHGLGWVSVRGGHLIAVGHARGRSAHAARTHRGRGRPPPFAGSCFVVILGWELIVVAF